MEKNGTNTACCCRGIVAVRVVVTVAVVTVVAVVVVGVEVVAVVLAGVAVEVVELLLQHASTATYSLSSGEWTTRHDD